MIYKFLGCGDLRNGFARIKCKECQHEVHLAFSSKGRYFCPSCHQKRVLMFGEWINEEILYPLPHRQYVFIIPMMLRPFATTRRTQFNSSLIASCGKKGLLDTLFPYDRGGISGALRIKMKEGWPIFLSGTRLGPSKAGTRGPRAAISDFLTAMLEKRLPISLSPRSRRSCTRRHASARLCRLFFRGYSGKTVMKFNQQLRRFDR